MGSIPSEDLVRDLRQVARKLGNSFSAKEYRNAGGSFSPKTIAERFGGWEKALLQIRASKIKEAAKERAKVQLSGAFSETLLAALQKPTSLVELSNIVDASPGRVMEQISKLRQSGVDVREDNSNFWVQKVDVTRPQDKEYAHTITTKIGVVSDTHLGSKHQQLTHLHDFYSRCARQGINTVFHIGDVFAGDGRVYKGQSYDIFINGIDDVLDYAEKNYPKVDGIKTKFITGNHDLSWYKSGGIDIGALLQQRRPDMDYLGQLGVYINFDGVRTYFMHPTGGKSYAHSYKPQKFVEGFTAANKPQLFFIGHYHSSAFMCISNVYTFMCPCFEGQTSLFIAHGWMPEVGGWILDLNIDRKSNTITSVTQEYIGYPKLVEKDY